LKDLSIFDINYNQLKVLPNEIVELTTLTEFLLAGNSITKFPAGTTTTTIIGKYSSNDFVGMNKLAALTKLDLSANQITEFPIEIATLPKVQTLNLAYNKCVSVFIS